MHYFFQSIIKPYVTQKKYTRFCEIGAGQGTHTDRLLQTNPSQYTIIDPCVNCNLTNKYKNASNVVVQKGISLEVLPKLQNGFDCILIDGDHNWHTVYNELTIIEKKNLLNAGGTIFLHDVCWPYGRRDMYYSPSQIPLQYRYPHKQKGVIWGEKNLAEKDGTNAGYFNAEVEGGPGNGVLTAIEDFLKASQNKYLFFVCKDQHGLGVLFKPSTFFDNVFFFQWKYVSYYKKLVGKAKHYFQHPAKLPGMIRRKLNIPK